MNEMRWMTGSLIALALLTGGVASAQAFQPRNGAPQEQDDLSDEAQPPADDPGPPQADDDFSDVVAADQERGGAAAPSERYGSQDDPAGAAPADRESEDAITYCALAARDEAERDGGYAEVRQVQEPRETRNGYDVEGDVEIRSGWRTQDGRSRHFTCSVQNGRIADLYFRRDRAAR
ncbi:MULTISPECIES: hypothetical protein [Sphingobium]|uniref:Uncharacterized protein n=4 Tax=Sphingobium indicum TaxID=332055 RepID=D4YYH8_SPHIU|nr:MULTISPECIES: hypothetical protein [Sphingobium]KEY99512.1 hypothetical protein AI27_03270 [Sphingomonas sp. BHC-A]APL95533.1 hypothetical protein SIDU_13995 [Sphingobium indicum B90A]EQB07173.1 hypothetical protein L286_04465 [Sphingobium sp. HDIP04]KER36504.1 hypothetical protein AL00_10080 [Sphingobium indicum F2]NYI23102.1 hypothetical protein [Sphingobium indicum]